MARKQEQGINYLPLDVDFLSDIKVKILKSRYGTDGVMILIYILCSVYREGYYVVANDDYIAVAADDLGFSINKVEQVIEFLLKRSMFDEQLFKSDDVLTSLRIQERWLKAIESRARKTPITVEKYWLLKAEKTPPFVKCTYMSDNSEKKGFNSEKKGFNSEKKEQSKVKESKEKKSKLYTYTVEQTPTRREVADYCAKRGLNVNPSRFYNYYSQLGWRTKEGKPVDDWYSLCEKWSETEHVERPAADNIESGSFDTEDFFQAALKASRRESNDKL